MCQIHGSLQNQYICSCGHRDLCAWGPEATHLVPELGARLQTLSGEPRSTQFLKQRIDVALQRGNTAAVLSSFQALDSGLACIL